MTSLTLLHQSHPLKIQHGGLFQPLHQSRQSGPDDPSLLLTLHAWSGHGPRSRELTQVAKHLFDAITQRNIHLAMP